MKKLLLVLLAFVSLNAAAQIRFNDYFTDRTLRFDYMLAGNSTTAEVFPVCMKEEPYWGGSVVNLVDKFNYGNYRYEVYDSVSGILIYSKGFCTLYQEWQSTAEAKRMNRSFYEVATMPFPKAKVRFVISERKRDGTFVTLYETVIDPGNYFITREKPVAVKSTKISGETDPHQALDIAVIAEGYTAQEMEKFRDDVRKMSGYLFSTAPFDRYRDRINIYAVEAPSAESGTDVPGENIYANTVLNSSYYTFDVDRYLTTQDIKTVNDYAAAVPHDQIIILINSSRYGGGGVFNYYTASTIDHWLSPQVIVHEFGHAFAGLGDEYYSGEVAYEEYYPFDVEPWEPNLTTLVNFDAKWKSMIPKDIPVPTPNTEQYRDVTGLFEGGGYSPKKIYRPSLDCRMNTNEAKGFCSVCQKAVEDMIKFTCGL